MSDKQGAPTLPPLAGGGGNNGTSNSGAAQQTVSLQQVLASAQGLNVLTTPAGQQFVITSQVPGLTQVISTGTTTSAGGLQQVGFQRIVNITGGSPRVSVVGVASASGSPLASPSRQTATKVVLATSPKLVRTSLGSMFVTPPSQSSPGASPARKKLRLTETTERTTASDDPTNSGYRRRIMEHKMKRMRAIREKYAENASELFFLHAGGNMMDFQTWKRRAPTAQYLHFLRQHRLDPEDDDEDLTVPLPAINSEPVAANAPSCATNVPVPANPLAAGAACTTPVTLGGEVKITGIGGTPVAVSTTLPAAVAQLSQQGGTPLVPEAPKPQPPPPTTTACSTTTTPTTVASPIVEKSPITTAPSTTSSTSSSRTTTSSTPTVAVSVASPQPIVKLVKLPSSTVTSTTSSATPSESQNNQEQIVEKAKQEAYVMQRIAELQRDGLWPERRLPKVQEPARTKAHWDYLLEEMVWLAADFAQERKWKKAAAKKCARMVQKHFQEKAIQAQKAEKSHEIRLKKIAGFAAKEIKTFWANVEKLVEFKQQTRLEEKRKKALDQHLNFIVGQTEKYSTWLTEGLNKPEGAQSVPASINSSRISSPVPTNKQHSDDEFEPNQSSEDDEETIAKAEEEMMSTTNHKEEVELLKKESELPLEDLLKELPPNYLEERDKSLSPAAKDTVESENDATADGDTEFTVASEESSDDENTIMEQEKAEGNANHQQELDELKAENDMSIDELMAKYGNMPATPMEVDGETDQESGEDSEKDEAEQNDEKSESDSESEDETKAEAGEDSQTQSDDETGVGLKSLLEDLSSETPEDKNKTASGEQCENHNEMDDVAALAESIQPKGNTLLTTSVVTKIPFLLKHSLREYQHIGLDWLTTMYERKLNGILADEMGLGKTIQTIALLAHLACEKGNWGPHLIIVPTSVMLNWEMECKKWCPGFKILTYYGTQKERKQKRTGWTKPNAFHICITSYKLVIQDHQSFRRKKWKYLILDEAQNIKNFKSQRWQLLLNFQTQRRLLLTGTPLQNNLMELWSLMHFLMPNVFQSHREFKEWFSNPVTGMIEGNSEYNENIIRRLHKVLRPFLLRRLKTEVEKQLPKKYEHVVMCRLSKRQRYLYDDFMSRAKTKETLASGNLLSVINVLMQLRKVCNHPNLFEVRPTVSPFQMEAIEFVTASLAWSALDYHPFKSIDLSCLNLLLVNLEFTLTAFVAHRVRRLQTPRRLIEEIDSLPEPPPRCPSGKIKINVRLSNQTKAPVAPPPPVQPKVKNLAGIVPNPRVGTSPLIKTLNNQSTPPQGVTLRVAGGQQLQGYSVQLVQHQGSVKAIPVATLAHNPPGAQNVMTTSSAGMNAQRITMGSANIRDGLQRLTTQTVTVKQGDSLQRIAVPSFAQLVQTSTGRHIILTSNQQNTNTGELVSFPVMTPGGQRLTVLSKSLMGLSTANKVVGSVVTTTTNAGGRVGMRVPPLNVNASPSQNLTALQQPQQAQLQQPQQLRCGIVARTPQKEAAKAQIKEQPKSEFYLPQLEEERRQRRQSKLRTIANINERRCAACPLYGEDLFTALRIGKPASGCQWHNGPTNCASAKETPRTRRQFFSRTEALAAAIKSTEQIVEELKEVFQRFVVYVPAVRAPMPRFHVSHPPPHKSWAVKRLQVELERELAPKIAVLHPVAGAMMTQFPDPRLIQYDCGKLQSLDRLLRKLKTGNHRVLIFTQMTRMLDVLEAFLNFHGHIYLRLDGATKVDQRQVLMERFNGDKRIFCFILSTRSGGVGVNLTGADTVIFYDSDWNPTMDAQAQDRCHRIGQTRDVHIYRLVSEKTVEENILKKANQKRLLGDLAIEGGNFTTAYFKSSTIQDLFNVDQTENDASARMADVLEQSRDRTLHRESAATASTFPPPNEEKVAIGALESALAAAEEDLDVQAAKTAKAEAVADLAEFDENIPLDDADKEDAQVSKAEQEVQNLVSQLTPVERYAMKFVEESEGTFSAAQLAAAERELEQQKREWELDRLRALREEEERRLRLADDDEKPLTFGREDSQNQVNNTTSSKRLSVKRRAIRKNSAGATTRRASLRRRRDESASESESETTTDSEESESQDELVEDSPDEESSHTESQSQDDDEENDEEESEDDDEELRETRGENERSNARGGSCTKRRNGTKKSSERNNRWDLNSPRTRSRGNVKINLWTLDVSPILPGVKPNFRNRRIGEKRGRKKSDEVFARPISPSPKRNSGGRANSGERSKSGGEDCNEGEKAGKRNSGLNGAKEAEARSGRRNSNLGHSGGEKRNELGKKNSSTSGLGEKKSEPAEKFGEEKLVRKNSSPSREEKKCESEKFREEKLVRKNSSPSQEEKKCESEKFREEKLVRKNSSPSQEEKKCESEKFREEKLIGKNSSPSNLGEKKSEPEKFTEEKLTKENSSPIQDEKKCELEKFGEDRKSIFAEKSPESGSERSLRKNSPSDEGAEKSAEKMSSPSRGEEQIVLEKLFESAPASPPSSSPVADELPNIEFLLAEKMSEISSSMESSQSDESAEHERSCAFSPDSKSLDEESVVATASATSPEPARPGAVLSSKKIEKKSPSQAELGKTPRPTRSRPMNVKRLTQTFDASFDESGVSSNFETESVSGDPSSRRSIHVTRSSHKVTAHFSRNAPTAEHPEPKKIEAEKLEPTKLEEPKKLEPKKLETEKFEESKKLEPKIFETETFEEPKKSEVKKLEPKIFETEEFEEPKKSELKNLEPKKLDEPKKLEPKKLDEPKKAEPKKPEEPKKCAEVEDSPERIGESEVEDSRAARPSPSMRSSKRPGVEQSSPEAEKPWSAESLSEMIASSTQRRRSLATRSRNKLHLEEIARAVESVAQESVPEDATPSKIPEPPLERDFLVKPADPDEKIEAGEKFSTPMNKLLSEARVRLRRPDTPFPVGVLTRAKSTVPEASTSSPSAEAKLSPRQRRVTRLNSSLDEATSPRAPPPGRLCEASSPRVTTRSNSLYDQVELQSCTITLKPLQRKTLEALAESSEIPRRRPPKVASPDRPATRSSRPGLDNGFLLPQTSQNFRRSKSSESARPTRRAQGDPGQKRRPDTPLPGAEGTARLTRSGLDFDASNSRTRGPRDKRDDLDTDSNGNALHEVFSKGVEETASDERPQRTAKVVAILTLDSLSRGYAKTGNAPKRVEEGEAKVISVVDLDSGDESENGENSRRSASRRSVKRTRLGNRTIVGKVETDIQVVEIDDEEEFQNQPTRKIVKLQSTNNADRINSSAS